MIKFPNTAVDRIVGAVDGMDLQVNISKTVISDCCSTKNSQRQLTQSLTLESRELKLLRGLDRMNDDNKVAELVQS